MSSGTRSVTGVFRTPAGALFPNRTLTWFRAQRKTTAQAGSVIVDEPFAVTTDGAGAISAQVLPGDYLVLVRLKDQDRYFQVGIPEGATPFDVAEGIETSAPPITPDAVLQAQAARNEARRWASEAEDVPVETGPDRFSALHHAIKATGSASAAATSEGNAAGSASAAASSASSAASSEGNAAGSASAAATSASSAASSEGNAAGSASAAAGSAASAAISESTAASSASAAAASASDAATSEGTAAKWADEGEDVPVETGPDRFSARHWAAKAEEAAQSVGDPVPQTRQIIAGTGLSGGGALDADRTLAVAAKLLDIHNNAAVGFLVQNSTGAIVPREFTDHAQYLQWSNRAGAAGNPTVTALIATKAQAEDAHWSRFMNPERTAQAITARARDAVAPLLLATVDANTGSEIVITGLLPRRTLFTCHNVTCSSSASRQLLLAFSEDGGSSWSSNLACHEYVRVDDTVGGVNAHYEVIPERGLIHAMGIRGDFNESSARHRPWRQLAAVHLSKIQNFNAVRFSWFGGSGNFTTTTQDAPDAGKISVWRIA